jgi:DNA-binding NarL/FixJ family response regulator
MNPTVFLVGLSDAHAARVRDVLDDAWVAVELDGAEAAMEALEEQRPDLVVLDFPRPFRDGRSLTAALRADVRTAETPIVAVSGWDYRRTRETAAALGCTAFVAASAGEEELGRAVRGALPRRSRVAKSVIGAKIA